ncbi:phosphotransferase [Gryllotalpicola protaetiae]
MRHGESLPPDEVIEVPPSSPPRSVLDAFGLVEPPRLLSGGQGASWLSGGLVLKPESGAIHDWFATVASTISPQGFRLATPLQSGFGTWSVDGWSATTWLPGSPPDLSTSMGWATVLAAGRAFHASTSSLSRPSVLSTRTDRWAAADRMAWGEQNGELRPEFADVARRLGPLLMPLGEPQIVHGDLTLNVLLEPGLAPAIIDVSPYWRPTAYAEGVIVADALCWHGADRSLVEQLGVPAPAIARALLFRMLTTAQSPERAVTGSLSDELQRYERAATVLGT